ncbi:MAG: glucosaminidase domain-containing protein [Chitinophagaceae bacterium]
MKKLNLPLLLCLIIFGHMVLAQSSTVIKQYIEKYSDVAIEEMLRTGVPAAIKLAQGIHETEAGRSNLVLRSNNHFGIKCKSNWTGESVSHDDDARGECFRKYPNPLDSYKDHSDFLRASSRYTSLFELDPTDYESWAWGLKKAGYATNPKYPQIIIKLIQDYHLQDYTLIALQRNGNSPELLTKSQSNDANSVNQNLYPEGIFKINETKVVFVPKGTSYLAISEQHNVPLHRLFEFNDMQEQEVALSNQLIYLQRKRRTGVNEFHKVSVGETLLDIAQVEGIRLENLLEYNYLKQGMQPKAGELLYLHNKATAMPKLTAQINQLFASIQKHIIAEEKSNSSVERDDYLTHTVQPKETLYSISRKYSITVEDVLKWNDLLTTDLKAGQQLRINKKSVNATY